MSSVGEVVGSAFGIRAGDGLSVHQGSYDSDGDPSHAGRTNRPEQPDADPFHAGHAITEAQP